MNDALTLTGAREDKLQAAVHFAMRRAAVDGDKVIYGAGNGNFAREAFELACELTAYMPGVEAVRRASYNMFIRFDGGGEIIFRYIGGGAGRGYSADMVVADGLAPKYMRDVIPCLNGSDDPRVVVL